MLFCALCGLCVGQLLAFIWTISTYFVPGFNEEVSYNLVHFGMVVEYIIYSK